jgi:hypothetical protein
MMPFDRRILYGRVFFYPSDMRFNLLRYLDLEKFEWMIEQSGLYLCKTTRFKDPLEGIIPELSLRDIQLFEESIGMPYTKEKWGEIQKDFRESTYANCWHMDKNESVAMWKEYCPTRPDNVIRGVLVETTYEQLDIACWVIPEKYFLTQVKYVEDIARKYINTRNSLHYFAHKDMSFQKEKEARILHIHIGDSEIGFQKMDVDLCKLINKIYVHPCASNEFYEYIKDFLQKNAPMMVDKLTWSALRNRVDCRQFKV